MNSRERVTAILMGQKPDRVPVYPILSGVTRKLTGIDYPTWSTDADLCAESLILAAEKYEQDCIVTLIDLSIEADAWGQELIYPTNEAAHPDYSKSVIQDIEDYAKIKKVDYRTSKRMMMHVETCKKIVERKSKELPIVAFVFGPLGVLSMLRGQENLYMDLYDDPDAVYEAVGAINETLKDYCTALIEEAGVDAIMLDTLFASGSIMSKDMWLEAEGGFVESLSDHIRSKGAMTMIHNCGQKIYFDAQIEKLKPAAISFLYPPDDCKDFAECKAKYGDKVVLIGCVTPAMAVTGTDEEWDKACRDQIATLGKNGGFMLATGCEYPANAPFDRAVRMVNIAKESTY
jgi:Uroporphyrinogen-III decarboxylase